MKDRITSFLLDENISPAEFADKIGVQRSSISHVLTGRNYPSASFIQKMLAAYPNLNARWLMVGEGSMTNADSTIATPTLFDSPINIKHTVVNEVMQPEKNVGKTSVTKEEDPAPYYKTTLPKNDALENESPNKAEKIHLTDNKEIDRIIVLYKDKTFTSYNPF